ncbi:hypothetical protein EVAR_77729_1 [Eumeta japonica]|uniref:Uncharacterized protein n=1 Tax=Eumeta variegata TaxID=151549 RepID=A0A4C1TDR3_EUMVA|nr:hypothetical protein EVAR_77729_1 [Eumeta japonica]
MAASTLQRPVCPLNAANVYERRPSESPPHHVVKTHSTTTGGPKSEASRRGRAGRGPAAATNSAHQLAYLRDIH